VKTRKLGVLLAAVTVAAGAAACGNSGSGDAKADNTVSWMSWETTQANAAMDASFAAFTQSSGITMRRQEAPNADYAQKLASLIMSKKVPDFFWCSTAEEKTLASQHLLYDWSSYAAKNQGLDMSRFSPGSLDAWKAGGKLYGIPTLANTYGFFYNKKLFDKSGVAVPANGWTYDEMFADAAELTGKNGAKQGLVTQWTLLTSPHGLAQYSVSAGGAPLTETASGVKSITISPQAIQAAHRYAAAIKAGQITPAEVDEGNSSSAFANGSVPLMFGGQWLAQTFVGQKLGFDWGFVTMPKVNADVQPIESNGVCSPATLKNPDQAWKAIAYLETTGFNDTMKKIPVAPIAYQPGSEGYFSALQGQGAGPESMATAIKASLAAPAKVQTAYLDPWSSKALDIEKADWNPAIDGKTDTDAGIAKTVKDMNALASSSQ
jgi:multiple sugar transport system substrate-binding protein